MARFHYFALTASGGDISGRLGAESEAAPIAVVQRQGLLPISAAPEAAARPNPLLQFRRSRTVGAPDLILLSRQLGRLLGAGLPLDRALSLLAGLMRSSAGRTAVEAI